jgi:hypothetical protein
MMRRDEPLAVDLHVAAKTLLRLIGGFTAGS